MDKDIQRMDANPKILIIDDEEVVIDSCTAILAGSEYQLATASNGTQGLELVTEYEPDLVFVDLMMPGISGFEVLEKIQSLDPTIVTIVITGFATVSSAVEAMKQGAYDFLPKPFTPDEFRVIARRGVEKRNLVLETIALRREKEMLRENFAAIISHELKAPLSAVQQNLFTLVFELASVTTEDQQRRLERMKTRIGDLIALIRTWLRVFSTNIETIKDSFQPLSVPDIVVKAVESVEPHAIRKNIEIITSLDEPLSQVYGEEVTLTESLVNISNNAVKYSHAGSKIIIKAEEQDGRILISVSDSGIGIAKEDLPFIFGDFYRGKTNQTEKGVGLGLALSKRIVETHGGSITAESEPGKGSTFVIRLPIYLRD
ncbi:MAG: HAMP domain-containing histidine kinase [Chloroflexi bacterium]|nr:HAMP domain-containing histidine kinase [Chloroflexota bacterium]